MRNGGELAEGWYDPETLRKAQASAATENGYHASSRPREGQERSSSDEGEDDDDGFGPQLPSNSTTSMEVSRHGKPSGPSIPNLQDLQVQRGMSFADLAPKLRSRYTDVTFF